MDITSTTQSVISINSIEQATNMQNLLQAIYKEKNSDTAHLLYYVKSIEKMRKKIGVTTSTPSVTTTSAPSVTTTSAPSVTTTSPPSVTTTSAPSVTTTSAPSVTTLNPLLSSVLGPTITSMSPPPENKLSKNIYLSDNMNDNNPDKIIDLLNKIKKLGYSGLTNAEKTIIKKHTGKNIKGNPSRILKQFGNACSSVNFNTTIY